MKNTIKKEIKFEKMTALTTFEAKQIQGGRPTDSTGDTYFANQNAWTSDCCGHTNGDVTTTT